MMHAHSLELGKMYIGRKVAISLFTKFWNVQNPVPQLSSVITLVHQPGSTIAYVITAELNDDISQKQNFQTN